MTPLNELLEPVLGNTLCGARQTLMAVTRVGDEIAGFSVSPEVGDSALRIVGQGFWTLEIAKDFFPRIQDALVAHPNVSRVVFDFRALKPLRDEGQQGFQQVLAALRGLTHTHVCVQTASPLTKLQLLRIVKESGCSAWVEFV